MVLALYFLALIICALLELAFWIALYAFGALCLTLAPIARWLLSALTDLINARHLPFDRARRIEISRPQPLVRSAHDASASRAWRR
jgi:hypothetical protein